MRCMISNRWEGRFSADRQLLTFAYMRKTPHVTSMIPETCHITEEPCIVSVLRNIIIVTITAVYENTWYPHTYIVPISYRTSHMNRNKQQLPPDNILIFEPFWKESSLIQDHSALARGLWSKSLVFGILIQIVWDIARIFLLPYFLDHCMSANTDCEGVQYFFKPLPKLIWQMTETTNVLTINTIAMTAVKLVQVFPGR